MNTKASPLSEAVVTNEASKMFAVNYVKDLNHRKQHQKKKITEKYPNNSYVFGMEHVLILSQLFYIMVTTHFKVMVM